MSIQIAYFSKTGHSEKIARAMGDALNIEPVDIAQNPSLSQVDLLFIVSGIYYGQSDNKVVEFGRKLKPAMVQRVALVTSCSSGKYASDNLSQELKKNYIEILGECIVLGSFFIRAAGRPNQKDYNRAIEFAKKMIKKV